MTQKLSLILAFVMLTFAINATTFYSIGSGYWENSNIWSDSIAGVPIGSCPGDGDDVIIKNYGPILTYGDSEIKCASITIQDGEKLDLKLGTNSKVIVSGALTLEEYAQFETNLQPTAELQVESIVATIGSFTNDYPIKVSSDVIFGESFFAILRSNFSVGGDVSLGMGAYVEADCSFSVDGDVNIALGGFLQVGDGNTFEYGGKLDVFGTLSNYGTIAQPSENPALSAEFYYLNNENNGKYIHARNGGDVIKAIWHDGTECSFIDIRNSMPGNVDQAFWDVTWSNLNQNEDLGYDGAFLNARGTIKVKATGTAALCFSSESQSLTYNLQKVIVSGGTLKIAEKGDVDIKLKELQIGNTGVIEGSDTKQGTFRFDRPSCTISNSGQLSKLHFVQELSCHELTLSGKPIEGTSFSLNGAEYPNYFKLNLSHPEGIWNTPTEMGAIQTTIRCYPDGRTIYNYNSDNLEQRSGDGLRGNNISIAVNLTNQNGAILILDKEFSIDAITCDVDGPVFPTIDLNNYNMSCTTISNKLSVEYSGNGSAAGSSYASNNFIINTDTPAALPSQINNLRLIGHSSYALPNSFTCKDLTISQGSLEIPEGRQITVTDKKIILSRGSISDVGLSAASYQVGTMNSIARTWTLGGNPGLVTFVVDDLIEGQTQVWKRPQSGDWQAVGSSRPVVDDKVSITIPGAKDRGTSEWTIAPYDETLPVELAGFYATVNAANNVVLSWTSNSETGLTGYYILRSTNPNTVDAQVVSHLIPAHNSSNTVNYSFTDKEELASGVYYYWLMVQEMNGEISYHGPVALNYHPGGDTGAPGIPLISGINRMYPNPFDSHSIIKYDLANNAKVRFEIYNQKGQLVKSFAETSKAAGRWELVWDGKDNSGAKCSSGIYFVKMSWGNKSQSQKLIIIR